MQNIESKTETLEVRGLRYNVRHWGSENAPKVFFLHGWMDCSPTFQFLVNSLRQPWHVIAPDWRGFGASQWLSHPYWFPDYYADLEVLLRHYSPDEPARIVGHSMGASIGATYAAVRPERISQLVMMDFLGLTPPEDVDAPQQIGHWLDAIDASNAPRLRTYENNDALARRLRSANPRLREDRAAWLAANISRPGANGGIELACDPWHKVPSPAVYRVEDAMDAWRKILAPVLMLVADKGFIHDRFDKDPDEYQRRIGSFANVRTITVADAGHNVQHDQPEFVAREIEEFLLRG
ncbi:MAG TPA: alpha/beta hydrolase [Rhodocyclaceae bacterium]|nr:alpha/beta hydrolase [Rhodocyclaceae bacterium]